LSKPKWKPNNNNNKKKGGGGGGGGAKGKQKRVMEAIAT